MNSNYVKDIDLNEVNTKDLKDLKQFVVKRYTNAYLDINPYKDSHVLYRREDLDKWSEEAFRRGEKYFYCKPVNKRNPYGRLVLCEPEYEYELKLTMNKEEYETLFDN